MSSGTGVVSRMRRKAARFSTTLAGVPSGAGTDSPAVKWSHTAAMSSRQSGPAVVGGLGSVLAVAVLGGAVSGTVVSRAVPPRVVGGTVEAAVVAASSDPPHAAVAIVAMMRAARALECAVTHVRDPARRTSDRDRAARSTRRCLRAGVVCVAQARSWLIIPAACWWSTTTR